MDMKFIIVNQQKGRLQSEMCDSDGVTGGLGQTFQILDGRPAFALAKGNLTSLPHRDQKSPRIAHFATKDRPRRSDSRRRPKKLGEFEKRNWENTWAAWRGGQRIYPVGEDLWRRSPCHRKASQHDFSLKTLGQTSHKVTHIRKAFKLLLL